MAHTDTKAFTLTTLIKRYDLSLSPATMGKALVRAGVMEEILYLSTTGSGEEKSYRVISEDYSHVGINKRTIHPFKTEPRFYEAAFQELAIIVLDQIIRELGGGEND